MHVTLHKGQYELSTDPAKLDPDVIHGFLTSSYWAAGISREVVRRSIENSLCFGVYQSDQQVAFARVVSDFATFAYVGDVFVLEAHRGKGLSQWMMESIMNHERLQHLRRWTLLTRDAHGLFEKFGFTAIAKPDRYMERHNPHVYKRKLEQI